MSDILTNFYNFIYENKKIKDELITFLGNMKKRDLECKTIIHNGSSFSFDFFFEEEVLFTLEIYKTFWAAKKNMVSIGRKDKSVEDFEKDVVEMFIKNEELIKFVCEMKKDGYAWKPTVEIGVNEIIFSKNINSFVLTIKEDTWIAQEDKGLKIIKSSNGCLKKFINTVKTLST